ncbi:MAG: FAD:protein FMN transferase [Firmicutes bacterium]|nr:FAD:protein FMN transferase [Bacillota bacterium]
MFEFKKELGSSAIKWMVTGLLMLSLIIPQLGCMSSDEIWEEDGNLGIEKTGFYLDTVCKITIYGVNPKSDLGEELAKLDDSDRKQRVQQVITDAFLECDRYEKMLSKTISSSEISKINNGAGQPVAVSDVSRQVIKKGIEYGELSQGVFDITIGKASSMWDFHDIDENHEAEGEIPDEEALAEAIRHVDYKKVKISGEQVELTDPEMEMDLGGIAKGYIADRLTEYLEEQGVISAVISLGGNIVVLGSRTESLLYDPPEGSGGDGDFRIGIADPHSETGGLLGTFSCTDKAIVTSGTYERYVMKDGVKYHHILDVETGYPVETDVDSVTIIAEKGSSCDADGLSTICLTLGMEKGLDLIRSMDGVEAVFVDKEGNIEISSHKLELEL